ncbi:MAG: tetratricopeptide repeat protein [Deltaproteobacteria bacterium]|nr:tetratricopeptide repeat protein [Deltaproteobacteria bacterium]
MKLRHVMVLCSCLVAFACKKPAPPEEAKEPAAEEAKPAEEEMPAEEVKAPEDPVLGRETASGVGGRKAFQAFRKGVALMKRKKGWEKAAGKLREALDEDPELPEAVYNLARVQCRAGELGACAETLGRAMMLCYPCSGPLIAQERDFDALRESDGWSGVEEAMRTYEGAWKRALSSPGAFMIVGISRLTPGWAGEGKVADESSRGVMCFYHHGSGRLLPLMIGQNAAGFLLDGSMIHVLSYGTIEQETDIYPTMVGRLSVRSIDLETLASARARIPGSATSAVLHVQEGVTQVKVVLLELETADEKWRLSTFVDGKLSRGSSKDARMTPTSMDPMADAAVRKFCAKRIEESGAAEPYLLLDSFCDDLKPSHASSGEPLPGAGCTTIAEGVKLCHEKTQWEKDEKLTLSGPEGEKVLLEAPGFVQIDVRG